MNTLPVSRACDLTVEADRTHWLIDQLWAEQAVGILGGEPKCCKSFLALDIAVSVASGVPCLRRFPVRHTGPVLLFPAEDSLSVVRRRLEGICAAAGAHGPALAVGYAARPPEPAPDRGQSEARPAGPRSVHPTDEPCATPARVACCTPGRGTPRPSPSSTSAAVATPCSHAGIPVPSSASGGHACEGPAGTSSRSACTYASSCDVSFSSATPRSSHRCSKKSLRKKRRPILGRRWVKKRKKMISMNPQEEDPAEENRFSNRPNYPTINPPLRTSMLRLPAVPLRGVQQAEVDRGSIRIGRVKRDLVCSADKRIRENGYRQPLNRSRTQIGRVLGNDRAAWRGDRP